MSFSPRKEGNDAGTEEQRPHIDGAGEYTCTGNPGKAR